MPRQNRVTPRGDLIAAPVHGTLMGNRGCLHDANERIRRHHLGHRWIYCLLEFKDRHRAVMTPGRYTELFFLDEVTALAAGHRPCAECQRTRFDLFRTYWAAANPATFAHSLPTAAEMDLVLHRERVCGVEKVTQRRLLSTVPAGAFVLPIGEARPCLVTDHGLLTWDAQGYKPRLENVSPNVDVLTPASIMEILSQGYPYEVHPSSVVR